MKIFRYLLLTLVLVTVALVSALTAMRLAIHGREVSVPNLIGMSPAEARRVATAAGFPLVIESRFYSAQVPEGKIVSQSPPAASLVRRGWQLRVAESLGPQRVSIPDVVQSSSRAAEMNIRRRGLDVGTVAIAHVPGQAVEQVIAQNPPGNAGNVSSPRINLLVTAPEEPQAFVMPNLVGKQSGEVIRQLRDAGLRLIAINNVVASPGQAADVIVRQSPAAGQKVTTGTGVSFDVAR